MVNVFHNVYIGENFIFLKVNDFIENYKEVVDYNNNGINIVGITNLIKHIVIIEGVFAYYY